MKKNILITGSNSYVGTSVEKWLMKEPEKYQVDTIDMKDPKWREHDFSKYDVVFHVAGIAHVSSKKKMKDLYYKVNRDLAIETAKKAKESGVTQFIFMSSMIVYGKDNKIGDFSHIDVTSFNPINAYGKSKLEADLAIQDLKNDSFHVVILRPPAIYGPRSKGNFPRLVKLALKSIIFPDISNQRSMLYISNLCEIIKLIIASNSQGIFYPQNPEYLSTKEIVEFVRKFNDKKYRETRIFNPFIILLSKMFSIINKVFGNKTYSLKDSNHFQRTYCIVNSTESLDYILKNQ